MLCHSFTKRHGELKFKLKSLVITFKGYSKTTMKRARGSLYPLGTTSRFWGFLNLRLIFWSSPFALHILHNFPSSFFSSLSLSVSLFWCPSGDIDYKRQDNLFQVESGLNSPKNDLKCKNVDPVELSEEEQKVCFSHKFLNYGLICTSNQAWKVDLQ